MSEEDKIEYPDYLSQMPDDIKKLWEELTDKQRKFIVYYVQNSNATRSAIKAGYSKGTAKEIGYQNFTKLHIKKVSDWMNKYVIDNALDTSISTAHERMQLLTDMQRSSISLFTNGKLEIKANEDDLEESGHLISSISNSYDKDGNLTTKLKMHSSIDAIKELNKMQGSHAADKLRHVDVDDNDVKPQAPVAFVTKEQLMSKKELEDIGYTET